MAVGVDISHSNTPSPLSTTHVFPVHSLPSRAHKLCAQQCPSALNRNGNSGSAANHPCLRSKILPDRRGNGYDWRQKFTYSAPGKDPEKEQYSGQWPLKNNEEVASDSSTQEDWLKWCLKSILAYGYDSKNKFLLVLRIPLYDFKRRKSSEDAVGKTKDNQKKAIGQEKLHVYARNSDKTI